VSAIRQGKSQKKAGMDRCEKHKGRERMEDHVWGEIVPPDEKGEAKG